ncbi:hypothetical protein GUF49_10235, partial [Xanthomonas citri pv. citri]|nr:hypothetical protein [Xanthomonas citri pv. citri]
GSRRFALKSQGAEGKYVAVQPVETPDASTTPKQYTLGLGGAEVTAAEPLAQWRAEIFEDSGVASGMRFVNPATEAKLVASSDTEATV